MRLFETQLARSLFALAALVALGVAGYMLIEGWSFLDAAYMTILTFTTVGYDEVRPLSSTGRVFTMFVMVAGVGVMLYILTSVVHMVVAQEVLRSLVRRHRMRTRMAKLSNHFIVCGFGRVGRAVALTLQEKSAPLVVIDKDEAALTEAEEARTACTCTAIRPGTTICYRLTLKRRSASWPRRATTATTSTSPLTARGLNPSLRIVARASRADAEDKLRRAGADEVISPHVIGGRHMALSAIEWCRRPESNYTVFTYVYSRLSPLLPLLLPHYGSILGPRVLSCVDDQRKATVLTVKMLKDRIPSLARPHHCC